MKLWPIIVSRRAGCKKSAFIALEPQSFLLPFPAGTID